MVIVVPASRVEEVVEDLPFGTVLVVSDPDGETAAKVSSRVNGYRTAVFVGDLATEADRRMAEEFCREMFGATADEIELVGR